MRAPLLEVEEVFERVYALLREFDCGRGQSVHERCEGRFHSE